MKSMLIAATVVGAAAAGVILYLKKTPGKNKSLNSPDAATGRIDTPSMNAIESRSHHAMG